MLRYYNSEIFIYGSGLKIFGKAKIYYQNLKGLTLYCLGKLSLKI